jgi:translation elongation factor EF-G
MYFFRCQVNVSEPLIAFRETVLSAESSSSEAGSKNAAPVLPPPWCDITGLSHARGGRYRVLFGSGNVAITVRCFPLHISLARLLEDQGASLSEIDESLSELQRRLQSAHDNAEISTTVERFHKGNAKFWSDLSAAVESPKNEVEEEVVDPALLGSHRGSSAESHTHSRRVLSVGSPQHGTNMLIFDADATASIWRNALPAQSGDLKSSNNTQSGNADSAEGEKPSLAGKIALRDHPVLFYKLWARLHSACTAAFRMAVEAGPLMREPMHAVGFSIEAIEVNAAVASAALTASEMAELSATVPGAIDAPSSADSSAGSGTILTGQLISEMREALHVAALSLPVRIVEPVYKCDLQCDQSQIGNLYAVLSQRRGEVTSEDIIEGTTLFLLSAHLPVHSSFGFAQQLLKKTSGLGTAPQLSFSHWSRMDADPFW